MIGLIGKFISAYISCQYLRIKVVKDKEIQFEYIDLLHSHGTRCAGEVSGARDNGVCGVGVAYDSMVAGNIPHIISHCICNLEI